MAQVRKPTPKRKLNIGDVVLGVILIGIIAGVFYSFVTTKDKPLELNYPTFYEEISNDNVATIIAVPAAGEDNAGITMISGTLFDGSEYFVNVPTTES